MLHKPAERNHTIDLIKLIAAFFVICIHTKTTSTIDKFEQGSFSFIIDNVARFAVPFFFIASGYLIDFSAKNKVIKRLLIVVVLYGFWSLIFVFIRSYNNLEYPVFLFSNNEVINYRLNTAYKLLFYGYERHLWFFPAYIVAVLMILLGRNHVKTLFIFVIVLYAIGLTGQQFRFIYPAHVSFIPMHSFDYEWLQKPHLTRNGFFFAFPAMACGFIIKHLKERVIKLPMAMVVVIVTVLLFIQYIECTWMMNKHAGTTAEYYISTILLSCFILVLAIKRGNKKAWLGNVGKLSGGIYIIHPLFMYFFLVDYKELFSHGLWPYIFTPLLLILSLLSSFIISKIPYLRKLIAL